MMIKYALFILSAFSMAIPVLSAKRSANPDAYLSTPELLKKNGYSVETHYVTTKDGYILGLHRCLGRLYTSAKKRPVVLMHGLFGCSSDFVLLGPGRGLAYVLADEGYDVWLANARGNSYSRNHTTLSPNDPKFWEFCWDDIALIDLSGIIDFVIALTKWSQVYYVGHSQGTTTFFALCSAQPEYNDKIKDMFALSPVVYDSHSTSKTFQAICSVGGIISPYLLDAHELAPNSPVYSILVNLLCTYQPMMESCENLLFAITGINKTHFDENFLQVIAGHNPAGSSSRQLLHYCQTYNTDVFSRYDRGFFGNYIYYNSWQPPIYDLSKVSASVNLFYSKTDDMTAAADFNKLKSLKNIVNIFETADIERYTHIDFVFATNAYDVVYRKIAERFNSVY